MEAVAPSDRARMFFLLPAEVSSGDFLGGGGGDGGGDEAGRGGAGLDLTLAGLGTSVFDLMDLTGDCFLLPVARLVLPAGRPELPVKTSWLLALLGSSSSLSS